MSSLQLFKEPLNEGEIAFLKGKERNDRKQYYRVFTILMIASFVLAFAGAWYRAIDGDEAAFSYSKFFISVTALLFLSVGGVYTAYRVNLRKVQQDIKELTKTIEVTHITRKQYMPRNDLYFFYLSSKTLLNIEVTFDQYHLFNTGDEVNIEYATHSKLILGFF